MAQCIILTGGVANLTSGYPLIQRSLGPYRLSSALEDAGYSAFVFDYIIHFSMEEIKQVLDRHLDKDTLWVGFSSTFFFRRIQDDLVSTPLEQMYYTNYEVIHELIDYIRSKSKAKIVYGGARTPFHLADIYIDYYVLGYADVSAVALTNYLKTNDSSYLTHCEDLAIGNRTVKLIDSAKYVEPKMTELTTRWWSKHYNVLPGEGLPIELARGCIFKCKFCSYPLLGKKKGTYLRSPSEVRDELIQMWEAHGTTDYYITDDTFNDDNDKIEELHKVFTSLPFKPRFVSYLRIDLLNKYPDQADLLSEMGLIGTYFGLETMNPKSAVAIGKGLATNKVKDRLYWLSDKWKGKTNIGAGFILGLPYDTEAYFKELLAWCKEADNPLTFIDFYPLYLFRRRQEDREKLGPYTSEFSLNPDVYGYEFPGEDNVNYWHLKDQNLTFEQVTWLAMSYRGQMQNRNKFSEFQMITCLNTGISLEDLLNLPEREIFKKYNTRQMNADKINQYKQLVNPTRHN